MWSLMAPANPLASGSTRRWRRNMRSASCSPASVSRTPRCAWYFTRSASPNRCSIEVTLPGVQKLRDTLAAKGLAMSNIFLGAPKLHGTAAVEPKADVKADVKADAKPDTKAEPKLASSGPVKGGGETKGDAKDDNKAAAWTPRVKLDLSAK